MDEIRLDIEKDFHNKRFEEGDDRQAQMKYYWAVANGSDRYWNNVKMAAPGARILEYGCALGDKSEELTGSCASYDGIDISDVAIDHATGLYGRENVRFHVMDAMHMTFPDQSALLGLSGLIQGASFRISLTCAFFAPSSVRIRLASASACRTTLVRTEVSGAGRGGSSVNGRPDPVCEDAGRTPSAAPRFSHHAKALRECESRLFWAHNSRRSAISELQVGGAPKGCLRNYRLRHSRSAGLAEHRMVFADRSAPLNRPIGRPPARSASGHERSDGQACNTGIAACLRPSDAKLGQK